MDDGRKLLDIRLQMEIIISDREGMIAENLVREHRQEYPAYEERDFSIIASRLSKLIDFLRA